ncbi:unnamed protein product [Closterium sp. Yama58-4]|nr:unnamed protein product [Closterium sp. Yama58-4]
MPPKRTTKATADVTLPDDLLTYPFITLPPAGDGAEKQGSNDTVNVHAATDNVAGFVKESATAAAVAGGSGLSVEEKSQDHQAPTVVADDFLEDDEDEELEIDIAKEDAFRLRYTAILLIPMVLSQEIKATIAAVRLLMTKVWSPSLTENAGVTANIQEMSPGYVAKTRFCRLHISFLDERYAHHIKFHVFEISDSPGILQAATQYFTDLFGTDGRTSAEKWKPHARRKLDAEVAAGLAADWTEAEVKQAFKALADGKSPGKDGLPKELFERHWDVLGKEFLRMAQSFAASASNPASIKEAVTILLHKKGEKDNLDNYRPITLLNFTYKVLARVVANRMKPHLHNVISAEQYGFIPGRRISYAIGVVADVIEAVKKGNKDWYMLLVDFRKAFDSVSRSFLFSVLREMGFPERFVGWVEGLHNDTGTSLLINGWLGEAVDVKSGEAERRKLGLCNKANQRLAYVGYTDDTTLFLEGKRQIARAEKLLAWFAGLSGLQTNKSKSVILPIGHNIGRRPDTLGGFKWAKADEAGRVLGVWVTPSGSSEPTWKRAFEKIIVELIKWKALFLTIAARVVIINCYITSRISYQAQVYPPTEEIWKKLMKLIHNFLTGNNASAEKGFVLWNWGLLTTPKADGGLGALDPAILLACLAARRIGCLLLEENGKKIEEILLKAAGLPLGEDTFLAHERLLKHWPGDNERWLRTCETFMKSPIADTGMSRSREEVAQERVVFNRKLLLNGTNPVGRQKEAKGLWEMQLGDLVTAQQDGVVVIKDIDTLERELHSRDSARLALKALDAAPQEWKAMLTPETRDEGAESEGQNSSGIRGGREHAAATIFRSAVFTNGQLSFLKQLRESWATPDAPQAKTAENLKSRKIFVRVNRSLLVIVSSYSVSDRVNTHFQHVLHSNSCYRVSRCWRVSRVTLTPRVSKVRRHNATEALLSILGVRVEEVEERTKGRKQSGGWCPQHARSNATEYSLRYTLVLTGPATAPKRIALYQRQQQQPVITVPLPPLACAQPAPSVWHCSGAPASPPLPTAPLAALLAAASAGTAGGNTAASTAGGATAGGNTASGTPASGTSCIGFSAAVVGAGSSSIGALTRAKAFYAETPLPRSTTSSSLLAPLNPSNWHNHGGSRIPSSQGGSSTASTAGRGE